MILGFLTNIFNLLLKLYSGEGVALDELSLSNSSIENNKVNLEAIVKAKM